jgi:crossover junction endodeoxyribonuclease RuvC
MGKEASTILGIDPGVAQIGYGCIQVGEDDSIHLIDYGVISTSPKTDHGCRLLKIFNEVTSVIARHKPDAIAIETVFYSRNLKSLVEVSEAIGVITLAARHFGLEIRKFTPLEVKSTIVHSGRAGKSQIQMMVKALLRMKEVPKPNHAADALAIAICYNTKSSLKA